MIWFIPPAVALLAALPVFLGVRRVAREGAALRREMAALVALRAPVAALVEDVQVLRHGLPELPARTRPGAATAP